MERGKGKAWKGNDLILTVMICIPVNILGIINRLNNNNTRETSLKVVNLLKLASTFAGLSVNIHSKLRALVNQPRCSIRSSCQPQLNGNRHRIKTTQLILPLLLPSIHLPVSINQPNSLPLLPPLPPPPPPPPPPPHHPHHHHQHDNGERFYEGTLTHPSPRFTSPILYKSILVVTPGGSFWFWAVVQHVTGWRRR